MMKLRIQGNSLRFRLLRSEVTKFTTERRLVETLYLGAGDHASFTYALECNSHAAGTEVSYLPSQAIVILPEHEVMSWAQSEQVGIYSRVSIGNHGELAITIEKDFACLDSSDAENEDTFPNPQADSLC